jgi:septal ring-binding cell division protein DamX
MREPPPSSRPGPGPLSGSGAPVADEDTSSTGIRAALRAGTQLYVITLLAAPAPVALDPASSLPPHPGLSVFRSQRRRAGRDEHVLQFGWFESLTAAEMMLPSVRRRFPSAAIEAAPDQGMGSLDDTAVARFDLARAAAAAAEGTLVSDAAPAATAHPTADAPAVQHFAVQLAWSETPIDVGRFPRTEAFAGHVLYRVQTERDGRRWYGLRLGFFRDHLSARLVLQHARRDFALAAVVPVSDREYTRVLAPDNANRPP